MDGGTPPREGTGVLEVSVANDAGLNASSLAGTDPEPSVVPHASSVLRGTDVRKHEGGSRRTSSGARIPVEGVEG